LEQLIGHCVEQGKRGRVHTPSDYGLGAAVTSQELDLFMEEDEGDTATIMSF
jgi:hypothetical protein